jgi:hypothetical protein
MSVMTSGHCVCPSCRDVTTVNPLQYVHPWAASDAHWGKPRPRLLPVGNTLKLRLTAGLSRTILSTLHFRKWKRHSPSVTCGRCTASRVDRFNRAETASRNDWMGQCMGHRAGLQTEEENFLPLLRTKPWPSSPKPVAMPTLRCNFVVGRNLLCLLHYMELIPTQGLTEGNYIKWTKRCSSHILPGDRNRDIHRNIVVL